MLCSFPVLCWAWAPVAKTSATIVARIKLFINKPLDTRHGGEPYAALNYHAKLLHRRGFQCSVAYPQPCGRYQAVVVESHGMANAEKKTRERIAILGGGVGAMSAAMALTSVPGWQDRYEITVYQMGWRLGGKGASGRDQNYANRIYEHGLHLWMGFYENAFRQIRDAYAEWNARGYQPKPLWKDYTEAFSPQNYNVAMEQFEGTWNPWVLQFPESKWKPGQDVPGVQPLNLWDLVLRMLGMMLIAFLGARWQTGFRGWILRIAGRIALWIGEHLGPSPIVRAVVRFLETRVSGPWLLPFALAFGSLEHRSGENAREKHRETVLSCLE